MLLGRHTVLHFALVVLIDILFQQWSNRRFLAPSRQNHLSNAGVISLANGLRSNRSVKTLNLMTQMHGINTTL